MYGTAAASYLATDRSIFGDIREEISCEFVTHEARFYVDDLLTGADTLETTLKIKDEIIEILNRGGFQLNKLVLNDKRMRHSK